ncbi:MAG: molybdate ABC transporter substrate-binding protein [Terriglobales bacterium]
MVAILGVAAQPSPDKVLTIAAASDLQMALPEVVAAYERTTGNRVRVSFGSSGNLFAQIQNGAPFDVFLSADVDYPRRLEAAGLTRKDSLSVYASGHIVVWTPKGSPLNIEHLGLKGLTAADAKRIAIANPAHAPYGRAAQAALKHAGIYEQVKSKLILGENISQAVQFVHTGNAQAGIIALSMAKSPRLQDLGHYWVVPQEFYPRMEQAAVVLKSSKKSLIAEEFMQFLLSPAGAAILKRFNFEVPERKLHPQQAKP